MKFKLIGVVDKSYQDTITMTVEADSLLEAHQKGRDFLCQFPKSVTVEGVTRPSIDNRDYKYSKVVSCRIQKGKELV